MSAFTQFFKKIFRREKIPPPENVKTAPLDPSSLESFWDLEEQQTIAVGAAQSIGIERDHNEDTLFVLLSNATREDTLPDFGLFLVADGMGGHRAGEVASSISVRTTARLLTEGAFLRLLENDNRENELPLQELIREALEKANDSVVAQVPGGGTTLTAALLLYKQLTIGHVGDSRAYIIKDGKSEVITRDHSLVERLKELGQISPEEAASHPQRNVLYRAIGQGANLEVDIVSHPIPRGGYLLLCSDGLWGVVPDHEIRRIIYKSGHPQAACEELVRAANAAGGPDNISAVLVGFPP
ncbi:MAG TPA: serine/threonine-protein phosphatase, partial [Anaerolineae bacterium]|nr:serine/threonine-protein phosphatase [Anaerolineae bacterium]